MLPTVIFRILAMRELQDFWQIENSFSPQNIKMIDTKTKGCKVDKSGSSLINILYCYFLRHRF